MPLNSNVVLFLCLSVFIGYCELVTAFFEEPQILANSEDIIAAGHNHTIFCQGNQPLKWTVPEVKEHQTSWSKFRQEPEVPMNTQYQYGLRLHITNISYPFVGYYYCHHQNASKDSETESKKVYLFVDDEQHLAVIESAQEIIEIIVTQKDDAVIPCRPTSPNVRVTLQSLDTGEIEDASYNPKTGFSFYITDLSQHKVYYCSFSRNSSETYDILFNLIVRSNLPVSYLAIPDLRDVSDGHTVIGDTLTLRCMVFSQNVISFHWETPNGPIDDSRMTISLQERDENNNENIQYLTVANTTLRDNGIYTCKVADNQHHHNNASVKVKIFGKEEHFIIVEEPNDFYHTVTHAGKESIQWVVDVNGHPKPSVKWLIKRKNEIIPMVKGKKYEAEFDERKKKASLVIKDITVHDMGTYVLKATNKYKEEKKEFFLNVTDKPTVSIEAKPFYRIGTVGTVKCIAAAYPEPEFFWTYKSCMTDCPDQRLIGNLTKKEGFLFISEVKIQAEKSGFITCRATNMNGTDQTDSGFFVSDVNDGFDVFGFDDTVVLDEKGKFAIIAIGEPISMTCGASEHNYTDITWYYNGEVIANDDRHHVENSFTDLSRRIRFEIREATYNDRGMYTCRVGSEKGYLYKNITVTIKDPVAPHINQTNMKNEAIINIPYKFEMFCKVYGIPKPTLTWYKDGKQFVPTEQRINVSENLERISFNFTDAKDEGEYECRGVNKMGKDSRYQRLKFKNLPKSQTWLIVVIVLLSIFFFVAVVFIIIKTKKERDLQKELKKIGLDNFQNGQVQSINPNLGVDEQAELLPYDKKWEFPIERLKLGKQLGSGAFGVVMKGLAKNIVDGEDVTTVAVKMVKTNADHIYIKSLASELKVMVHLGKHLNVVNLLGACTKNVAKRELFVIVEYCRFGNVQNYLIRHRNNFINQVDPKSGNLDFNIGQEYLDRTYSVSSNNSNPHSPLLKYAALAFSNSNQSQVLPPSNSMGDYRGNNSDNSANTQMTTVPQGEEGGVLTSNNSIQPDWRSNYRGDYKGHVKPISTNDLLAWSFQIARGMEYLASRKVLHGDLAARNILLSDDNIVKICDFGLAKSMYKSDNYKKSGNCLLPVKWMAIESIRDRVFSTQSDVWSFGIVLWELFSLARTPYPGMETHERLYHKLVEGYRMESPEYAPKLVYQMMTECWSVKPLTRPTFTKLAEKLGNLLEDTLRQYYIDLNDPYLKMNTKRLEDGQSDYLAMLSPPTFEVLSSPQYVNDDVIVPPAEETDGYLSMKPNLIFSPRVTEDEVFDFNVNNRKNVKSQNDKNSELLPMLNIVNESDSETPLSSPFPQGNSVSNPTYHHLPSSIKEEETNVDTFDNSNNMVKTSDNYVNMSDNKNNLKDKPIISASTNPFVNVCSKKPEVHYVNEDTRDWEQVNV